MDILKKEKIESRYKNIILPVESDVRWLEEILTSDLDFSVKEMKSGLIDFMLRKSKRIRAVVLFLVVYAFSEEITSKIMKLSRAVELIHNASLLHDDVIDNAALRRGMPSFNNEFGDKMSVIGGDYLLSCAMKDILSFNDSFISDLFLSTLKTLCEGEVFQHYLYKKVCTVENYIDKSYKKTACLFEAEILSGARLLGLSDEISDELGRFAKNFGIAFQIKDDYKNIYESETSTDIEQGVYTAPVIYMADDYDVENISGHEIFEILKGERGKKYQRQTTELLNSYILKAVENLCCVKDNKYKTALIDLCEFLKV